jgi:hypothetical protein
MEVKLKSIYKILIVTALLNFSCFESHGIQNGENRDRVISELGAPDGIIKSGDYEMLSYERGKIELRDGLVISVNLLSQEDLIAKKKNDKALSEKKEKEKNEFIKLKHQRGIELREKILTSSVFPEFSGRRKVEILKNFRSNYPDIDITDLLLPALDEMEKEIDEMEQQNKIVELEQRINDAKMEELRARWRESAAREDAQDLMRSQFYMQQHYLRCGPYYQLQTGGLSVGYDTPGIKINRSRGYSSRW